jgi:hypothetical protein
LSFLVNGKATSLPQIDFQVIDTSQAPVLAEFDASSRPLIDINCAIQPPDYSSAGGTHVRSDGPARYRESAKSGRISYRRTTAQQRPHAEPDWFAYTLNGITPQRRYRVEVDYPDNTTRTFAVAWREASPTRYPASMVVETGREHPLSGTTQTLSFHVWSRGDAPRLTFMPAHDEARAACQNIRVYAADAQVMTAPAMQQDSRQFLNWYEEGENFANLYGIANDDEISMGIATQRWMQAATEGGVNLLMPTVSIYGSAMYPSSYNLAFSRPDRDVLRMLMLQAERYGMRVAPELHPRADDMGFAKNNDGSRPRNLALSREGRDNFLAADGRRNTPPYYNALHPDTAQWYTGVVRELAQRYADMPAFQGISLRYMNWANAGLNNLVNLNWGYDADTIARFRADPGNGLPARAAGQGNAAPQGGLLPTEREAWINWRCREIAKLFTRLRDEVRAVRPDLQLYLHFYAPPASGGAVGNFDLKTRLREVGIDLSLLADIDGLTLINSGFTYGRREENALFFASERDRLLDPALIAAPPTGPRGQWFVPTANYYEASETLFVPAQLGFSASTKPTWISSAGNPPGRRALERYALMLAQNDALALGDGGNNVTLETPAIAGFAREFRKLPRKTFNDIPSAVDPVTVRDLVTPQQYWFYAVNRENYPVTLRVELSGVGYVDAGEAKVQNLPQGAVLTFTLPAYGLQVVNAAPQVRIAAVDAQAPASEVRRLAGRIDWTAQLLSGKAGVAKPTGGDATTLAAAMDKARRALTSGRLWQARVALETSAVLQVFRKTGRYPPDMGFNDVAMVEPAAALPRQGRRQ